MQPSHITFLQLGNYTLADEPGKLAQLSAASKHIDGKLAETIRLPFSRIVRYVSGRDYSTRPLRVARLSQVSKPGIEAHTQCLDLSFVHAGTTPE